MPRYINADELLAEAKRLSGPQTGDGWDNWGVYALIERQPTADVVEVVRCLECVYNRGETKDLWGNPAIKCVTAVTHEPDWYCASGKRKDGGRDGV